MYAEHEARVSINTLEVISGELPSRALNLVREWAALHRDELLELWQRAIDLQPLHAIEPLP